jgi:hypothetical protein
VWKSGFCCFFRSRCVLLDSYDVMCATLVKQCFCLGDLQGLRESCIEHLVLMEDSMIAGEWYVAYSSACVIPCPPAEPQAVELVHCNLIEWDKMHGVHGMHVSL